MIIQINTDKTLSGHEKMQEYFNSRIKESLKRYQSHITRVEVHLKDENSNKDGLNDISCLLEARLEGRQPIVATDQADTIELALTGALTKIETAIETILGRIKNH
jgi:ribosomal subunit interface protein